MICSFNEADDDIDPVSVSLQILKGDDFAAQVAHICQDLLPSDPWPGLKYQRILVPGLTGSERQVVSLGFIAPDAGVNTRSVIKHRKLEVVAVGMTSL